MKALIFDCDGVLVDTEKDGHRVAFNRAFAELGLDLEWSVAYYGELLKIAGGKERMRHHFDAEGWPPTVGDDKDAFIARLHQVKTGIFTAIIADGGLPLRPGILRIVDEAIAAGVRLGVCTTSNPRSIDGVLNLMGQQRKARFEFVHAGDVVARKKPDPEIYELAKTTLGLPAAACCVIEDSRNGMLAAIGAGLPCLITTSTYTIAEDFTGAIGVVSELGDEPTIQVTLESLTAMAGSHGGQVQDSPEQINE